MEPTRVVPGILPSGFNRRLVSMMRNPMHNSTAMRGIAASIAILLVSATVQAQSSRLATSSGTNAKSPPAKSTGGAAKSAGVKNSKATSGSNQSGLGAAQSSAAARTATQGAAKPATPAAPATKTTAKPATPAAPATTTEGKPAGTTSSRTAVAVTPPKTRPAETKTVTGTTQAGKPDATRTATIARPTTTSLVADAKGVATTGPTAKPVDVAPKPADVAAIKPEPVKPATDAQVAKGIADFTSGTMSAEELTRMLAAGTKPPPVTEPPVVAPPALPVPPVPPVSFAVARQPLPAITETARFKAWTWHGVDKNQTDFQVASVWFGQAGGWVDSSPSRAAQLLNALPPGQRVLFFWDMTSDLARHPSDDLAPAPGTTASGRIQSPWMDNATPIVRDRVAGFMNAFAAAGGQVDAVLVDNETDLRWETGIQGTPEQIAAIHADPRFPALAQELGFNDLNQIGHLDAEYQQWNAVMGRRFDAALQAAAYEPIRALYPNATVSNYEVFACLPQRSTPWCTGTPDIRYSDGFGTHDTHSYYGLISSHLATVKYDGQNNLGQTAFDGFRMQIHRWRACDFASPRPMQAWISPKHNHASLYDPSVALTLNGSPYYDETLLHLGAGGCDTFLYWNPGAYNATMIPAEWNRIDDQLTVDSCLRELNEMLGQNPGPTIPLEGPGWGDKVIATGRQVGDRMVWRFTFAPGITGVSVKFKDGTTQTITAEGARPGAWFGHPANMEFVHNSTNTAPEMTILTTATP